MHIVHTWYQTQKLQLVSFKIKHNFGIFVKAWVQIVSQEVSQFQVLSEHELIFLQIFLLFYYKNV